MKQLDGLRGIAVGLVLVSHFPPHRAINRAMDWGRLGVELFFVLSGFLITGILLRGKDAIAEARASYGTVWRAFFARRMLRIFPLFYATLLFLYVADLCDTRRLIWYHAAYLTNFYMAATNSLVGHTSHFWSLAVEEQFYLVWPWVILLIPKSWLPSFLGLCVLSAPTYRLVGTLRHWNFYAIIGIPFANLDTLCGGALLAVLSHRPEWSAVRDRIARYGIIFGTVGLCGFLLANTVRFKPYGMSFVGLGLFYTPLFFGLVARSAQGRAGALANLLTSRPLVYLGKVSYCVYVVHVLIPPIAEKLVDATGLSWLGLSSSPPLRFLQVTLATLLIAEASRRWFEGPLQRQKGRFAYKLAADARPRFGRMPTPR